MAVVLIPLPLGSVLLNAAMISFISIYHSDLDSAAFSVFKCHFEVVVNLSSVEGHFYLSVLKYAFILLIESCYYLSQYLGDLVT